MLGKIILAALCVGLCSFLFRLKDPIEAIVESLCGFIDRILMALSKPLIKLWACIKAWLLRLFSWSDRLPITGFANRHPVFGRPSGIRLFLISAVYLFITFIAAACTAKLDFFAEEMFYYMPLGFLVRWCLEGLAFDPLSLLSAGFTGFMILMLFKTCMKEGHYFGSPWARLPVKILYYLVLSAAACCLSVHFDFVWRGLAAFATSLSNSVSSVLDGADVTFFSTLAVIGSTLCSLALMYLCLLLILISIREYIDIIGYSIIGVLLLIVVYLLMETFLPQQFLAGSAGNIVTSLVIIGTMLYSDYTRVNADLEA